MAYDSLNNLLTGADTGGTWSYVSGPDPAPLPLDLGLIPATGVLTDITISGGQVTDPVCLPAGEYKFLYTIEECLGSGAPFDTEEVSIVVQESINVQDPLTTIYICKKDGGHALVDATGAIPSPVLPDVNLQTETYITDCLGASADAIPVKYVIGSQSIILDVSDTGSNDGVDITIDNILFDVFNQPLLGSLALPDPDNWTQCIEYNVIPLEGCYAENPNDFGIIHVGPELLTFTDIGYTDECQDSGTEISIGTLLPDAFYTWALGIDNTPSPLPVGMYGDGPIGVSPIEYGEIGTCAPQAIYFEYDSGSGWTEFNPWDPSDPGIITTDGTGYNDVVQYRAVYDGPDGMFCVAESEVTVEIESCEMCSMTDIVMPSTSVPVDTALICSAMIATFCSSPNITWSIGGGINPNDVFIFAKNTPCSDADIILNAIGPLGILVTFQNALNALALEINNVHGTSVNLIYNSGLNIVEVSGDIGELGTIEISLADIGLDSGTCAAVNNGSISYIGISNCCP